MTTITQNFTLVSLTSIVTPYLVEFPLRAAVPSLPTHLSPYTLVLLRTCLLTYSTSHDGEKRWQGRMTSKDDNISSYGLDHLHSTPHCLRSRKIFLAVRSICALPTCRGIKIIISQALLNGVESKWSVGRNRVYSSLVQTSASSSRVYRLAGKGSPLVCHRYWSGLLAR